jgi:cbb3-type cytochrome oxidase subunit 3
MASNVATFRNLAGAVSSLTPQQSSKSNGNVGAIAGGAIGGAIALAAVIGCLMAFLLVRRRRQKRKEAARREQNCFVDLDDDEDPSSTRNDGRGHESVTQNYSVSPFVSPPTGLDNGGYHQNLEMASRTPQSAYSGFSTAAGIDIAPPSNESTSQLGPASSHSHNSSQQAIVPRHDSLGPATAALHNQRQSGVRVTNDDSMAGNFLEAEARPLPNKAQQAERQAARDHAAARRLVVRHSDGGPLPQPTSDDEEEELDELPPEYGGWLDPNAPTVGNSSSTAVNRTVHTSSAPNS